MRKKQNSECNVRTFRRFFFGMISVVPTFKVHVIASDFLTLVLLRGVVPTPLTVFALVLKIAQPSGKIAPVTFKFILSLHFSEKIPNLPPTPRVG